MENGKGGDTNGIVQESAEAAEAFLLYADASGDPLLYRRGGTAV